MSNQPDLHAPPRNDVASSLRVLVVDDSRDAADSLALLLSLFGHDVRVAYDGLTALGVASSFQPQVVLLDIGLPGMDGYEVAQKLRDQVGLRDARLIAATGHSSAEGHGRFREVGFDHLLLKPFEVAELQDLLAANAARRVVRIEPAAGPVP